MQRKKILWLASWYPNRNDRFDGDFIQRHARAAAICHDVHVIFVTDAKMQKEIDEEWNYATGLTEQIIYFKRKQGIAARIRKQFAWRNIYREAIKKYIAKNGLPDCVHVHVPWKAGLIAMWMKKEFGKDFIVTEHWGIYNSVIDHNYYSKSRLEQTLLKNCFQSAKAFVSVSEFLAGGVERIANKKADDIIPNVVDTTLFFQNEVKYSKFTFVHVSNMAPLKNVKGIIDAFKQVSERNKSEEIQLVLIGNKDHEYVKYAGSLGLLNSSVFFRGEIAYDEVAKEMQRSHCFILNSIMENSPCVIGEALCCGLPVIATNVGGVPELVNQSNGRLVSPNNVEELAKAIEEVMNNYSYFNTKSIAEEASQKFSYSAISGKFDELYRRFC